jgi:hypothetical protein
MFKGGRSVDALERELRDKRSLLEAKLREAEQSEMLAGESDAKLDEIAADVLAGHLTEAAAAKRLEELEHSTSGHRRNAALQKRAVEQIHVEIDELERAIAERPYLELVEKLPELAKQHQAASVAFAKAATAAVRAGETLAKRRAALDEATAQAHDRCPEWREFEFEAPDEATWPDGIKELVKLLQGGPRDDVAREAERVRRRDAEAKKDAARRVPAMVDLVLRPREASFAQIRARFDELSSDEQEQVLRGAAGSLARVEQEVRERFAGPDIANPWEADRAVDRARAAVESRIGRLREAEPAPVGSPA